MGNSHGCILAVDDDPTMRQILAEYLEDAGYDLVQASGGEEAWNQLQQDGERFHVVLLDRRMAGMDGMAVLAKMQTHETIKHIPVIMQTGACNGQEIIEGIEGGVFYYLAKPYEKKMLLALVRAAVHDALKHRQSQVDLKEQRLSLTFMQCGTFRVQTPLEVHALSSVLAKACPNPARVIMGLTDLLFNAVEHGNLDITFEEKTQLQATEQWEEEINRRLMLPQYSDKWVTVRFERRQGEIHITITDQGKGFDWHRFLEINPDIAFGSHGRGIAMAKALCFDQMEYRGKGNEVLCVILDEPVSDSSNSASSGVEQDLRNVPSSPIETCQSSCS